MHFSDISGDTSVAREPHMGRGQFLMDLILSRNSTASNIRARLHGAEPFSRSRHSLSHSRISQHFMEPEGSLPCSEEPSFSPCHEPNESDPYRPILSEIHFNVILPPTSRHSYWSLSFWISHQHPICIPLLRHSCHMPCPSHPP
jgi:hypothetical protein